MERGFINEMLALVDNGKSLSDTELAQINALFDKYQYAARNVDAKSLASLLKRVDIVPESMVLIQAANESGWGVHVLPEKVLTFLVNGVLLLAAA